MIVRLFRNSLFDIISRFWVIFSQWFWTFSAISLPRFVSWYWTRLIRSREFINARGSRIKKMKKGSISSFFSKYSMNVSSNTVSRIVLTACMYIWATRLYWTLILPIIFLEAQTWFACWISLAGPGQKWWSEWEHLRRSSVTSSWQNGGWQNSFYSGYTVGFIFYELQ